jgi:hypothetical protein
MLHMWNHGYPPFGTGRTEVLAALVLVFILLGHRLPGVMRDIGRHFMRGPWV